MVKKLPLGHYTQNNWLKMAKDVYTYHLFGYQESKYATVIDIMYVKFCFPLNHTCVSAISEFNAY